jgi:hypothetical protein
VCVFRRQLDGFETMVVVHPCLLIWSQRKLICVTVARRRACSAPRCSYLRNHTRWHFLRELVWKTEGVAITLLDIDGVFDCLYRQKSVVQVREFGFSGGHVIPSHIGTERNEICTNASNLTDPATNIL